MTIELTRRTVIKGIGALSAGVPSRGNKTTIDIGFYVSKDALESDGAEDIMRSILYVQDRLRETFPDAELSVGPEGIVETPDIDEPSELLDWWRSSDVWDSEHSNVLVMPYGYAENLEHQGYAYDVPNVAVSTINPWLILHEIGHTLGAKHRDCKAIETEEGLKATYMYPDGSEMDGFIERYSDDAKNRMVDEIYR